MPEIDITFASSALTHAGPEHPALLLASEAPADRPWYIRSDALPTQDAPGLLLTSGETPAGPATGRDLEPIPLPLARAAAPLPALELVPELDPDPVDASPGSALASERNEPQTPWFIRVDPPKSSLVGHLPALTAPAKRPDAVDRAAEAARKRAVSVRRRLRAEAAETVPDVALPQTAAALSISVLGCDAGSLALASAFALSGHSVVVVAQDDDTVIALETGEDRYPEPGLHRLHGSAAATGGLRFTVDRRSASGATVVVLLDAGDDEAISALLPSIGLGCVVVVAAPVAAGMRALERRIRPTGAELAWVPLLARDGMVVSDLLHPRGLVFGLPRDPLSAADVRGTLDDLYAFALRAGEGAGSVVDVDFATADLARAAGVPLLLAALETP